MSKEMNIFDFYHFCQRNEFKLEKVKARPRLLYRYSYTYPDKSMLILTYYDDNNSVIVDYKRQGKIYFLKTEEELRKVLYLDYGIQCDK